MSNGARLMELEEPNLDSRMKKLVEAAEIHLKIIIIFIHLLKPKWVMWGVRIS